MTLPPLLRQGIDAALQGHSLRELKNDVEILSMRYRKELRDGQFHLSDERMALAYLATRLPATYSALRQSFGKTASAIPDFFPETLLDLGAGPGSALWAAQDVWPSLKKASLVEASAAIRKQGEKLANPLTKLEIFWLSKDISMGGLDLVQADLVSLAYVLNELEPERHETLISELWAATKAVLLIIEPGTSAGWQRILKARAHLLAEGAHLIAPCPHSFNCPLQTPDWCHFSARLERSKIHRQAKTASLAYEDEKFSYLAVAKQSLTLPKARILANPHSRSGLIKFKLCTETGSVLEKQVSKRDGAHFKSLKRLDWGDSLDTTLPAFD